MERYRNTSKSIPGIAAEIVETIVRQLNVESMPADAQSPAIIPTENLAAYTAYLAGKAKSDVESIESLHAAIASFKGAIHLDPNFTLAYVALADAYLRLSANFLGGLPGDESAALAEPPLVRALALDESSPEAYATLGLLRQVQGNEEAAQQAFEKSIALNPDYPRAWRLYGRLRWQQSRLQEAMDLMLLDEDVRANDLLEGSLRVMATMPRLGISGYGICDVRIFALQQRPERALEALRQAVDEGWRIWSWFFLENDPNLDSIRDEPRFQRVYRELRTDLAAQARRVRELRASGELSAGVLEEKT